MLWGLFGGRTPAEQPVRREPVMKRRSYSAAATIARYSDFEATDGSADAELSSGMSKVRSKARALGRNSPVMKRYINLMQTNVVGPGGFRFQCRVKKGDGTLDKSLNERVEAAWADFCNSPCAKGRKKMRDFDRLAVASLARDGEFFIELVYDRSYRQYRYGVALHPLEADMCDHTLNTISTVNGNRIKLGVELDDLDRPVAYWMLTNHPGDPNWTINNSRNRHRRVPADRIIHVYDELRVGQSRGEPPASATVNPIKMLDGYREAEVTGRRVMAAQGGFIETEPGAAATIDALADGQETEDEDSDLVMNLEPGTIRALKTGQKFHGFNPGGSVTDFAQFDGQMKKEISMGLNISTMSLGMEVSGVSYSGGRTITIEDRDYYKSVQQFVIDNMKEPIFQAFIGAVMLSDNPPMPPSRVASVLTASTFRGRGWDWVDPAKDIKANALALETYQTSLTQIASERGIDIEDLITEIKFGRDLLQEAGLTPSADAAKPVKADGGKNA